MNVCLLSAEYPPETGWGGIGTYTYELAHGLRELGIQVHVVSASVDGRAAHYDDHGIAVHRVPVAPFTSMRGLWRLGRVWDGYNWMVAREVWRLAAAQGLDVVEGPEARGETLFVSGVGRRRFATVVRLHSDTRLVWHINGRPMRPKDRLTAWMERASTNRADAVVSPSRALLTESRVLAARRDRVRAQVLPNPIDCLRINARSSAATGPHEVLYVGRLEERKGTPELFAAMRLVWRQRPDATLILAGGDTGVGRREWTALDADQRTRVRFAGHVPRESIPQYLSSAAVCVFPSRWENFPYVCLEAMAAGLPVVASRNGGMAEMIEDGISGRLVDPGTPPEMADAILDYLRDPARAKAAGVAARARVEARFDTRVVVPRVIDLYERTIAARRQRRHAQHD